MANSKYQKFTVETINRADIKNAAYNPRIMDKEAKKRLKKGLQQHGLVSAITWNKRTGNLVGGHQRLEQLDALEKNKNYSLDVCVIDVDFMFDSDDRFTEMFDTPETGEAKQGLEAVKEARAKGKERMQEKNNINWYSVIVFEDEKAKAEFYKKINTPISEEYLTVDKLMRLAQNDD